VAKDFILNPAGLNAVLKGPNGPVAKYLVRTAIKVEALAKRKCPVKTGRLRSSIRWSIHWSASGMYARVGTDVAYALAVHEGHRAFSVTARNAQALRFTVGGETVFVARGATVNIPAVAGVPFLSDALIAVRAAA
jgi:hypothetical protein